MKRLIIRAVQFITGFHRIHHISYSYGYKIPFVNYGIFKEFSCRSGFTGSSAIYKIDRNHYHDCTKTGVY